MLVEFFHLAVLIRGCWDIGRYDGDVEWGRSQANSDESARDWSTAYDCVHVFVNKETDIVFVFAFLAAEMELVAYIG